MSRDERRPPVLRERLFAPHRVVLLGIVFLLAVTGYLALRGPSWWQRMYYPLEYRSEIQAAADRHSIDPYLIAAVVRAESDFEPGTVSRAGAVGLMQVMPETARELRRRELVSAAVTDGGPLSDPAVNVEYGSAYLRYLIGRYHEVETALAAYNAGLANADVWADRGGDIREAIDFPATRHYVVKVVRARAAYRRLYPEAFEWDGER